MLRSRGWGEIMFTKLRNLYYKIKYSNLKSNAGAVGVIIGNKKDKDDFNARIEEIAARTSPCYKTNDEVLAYIREKYNLTQITPSRSAVANYKVNYIMNVCPEVLKTPEYKLTDGNKSPSRKQMQAFHENSNKRFSEALDYPMEKLGIELECYTFTYGLSDSSEVIFKINADKTNDHLGLSSSVNRSVSEEEQKIISNIHNEIDVFKGVTKEDIDNRTNRFLGYAMAVVELEKNKE